MSKRFTNGKNPNGGASNRRKVDRIRAFCRSNLSPQHVIGEQIRVVGAALQANAVPAFYVLESKHVPQHAFSVWHGTETMTDEIRVALASNFWPGPPEAPSPQDLISGRRAERFVAVTLWGAAAPPMPWETLWRERNVRHGLYGAFFSPKGRIGILLVSRGNEDAAFEASQVAFVKACAPYIEAALDLPDAPYERGLSPAESVHIRFGADGGISAMSFGGPEMLRDLAGGGPNASIEGRLMVERANRQQASAPLLDAESKAALTLAGLAGERAFRGGMFELSLRPTSDPDRRGFSLTLGENGFGRFQLHVSTLVGVNGELERLGLLTRLVPPLLLRLRGALGVQATGREIQLLCALATEPTLKSAAKRLNIEHTTARTLGERLAARVGASGIAQASDRLMEIGRSAWPLDPGR